MQITLRKPEGLSKSKKGRQQSHHKDTHKYEKQRVRTARNKTNHIIKADALKASADAQEFTRKAWRKEAARCKYGHR